MGLEVIKEVYRKKAEERERLRIKVIKDAFKVLEKLKEEVSFKDAYIFGSAAQPHQFTEFSDIDIAFTELEKDKLFFVVSFLSSHLQRDVNVVHIEDIHFKDKILKEGIKWKKD